MTCHILWWCSAWFHRVEDLEKRNQNLDIAMLCSGPLTSKTLSPKAGKWKQEAIEIDDNEDE